MSDTGPAARSKPRRKSRRGLRALRLPAALVTAIAIFWVTGCMERMFYLPERGPTPVPATLPGAEMVRFASPDGTQLAGWFIPARGRRDAIGASPTVLHVHGNAGNIASHAWFTAHLPPAGFNVLVFDYRGYGESGGSARSREPLIADTEAALDYLLSRDDVDPARIGMYAQSLGGAIGLNVMAKRSKIRAAVLESPFSSWRGVAADAVSGGQPGWLARSVAAVCINDSCSPLTAIVAIDRPLLILHGEDDAVVPVHHSRRLREAAGGEVTLVELPGGDHNTLRETHPQVDRLMIEFLAEHLSSGHPASRRD